MKLSYSEELTKSINIYLDVLKELENFDCSSLTPAYSKAIKDSSELTKKATYEAKIKTDALNLLSIPEMAQLCDSKIVQEKVIEKCEENLALLKSSTRFAYNELVNNLPNEGCPAYLAADYEKTRYEARQFLSKINDDVDFIINKINRKTVIINYDFNQLVTDAREDLLKKNLELSEKFPEFREAIEARPISGVKGDATQNITPFIYELRNRIEIIKTFFDEQDLKFGEAKQLIDVKLTEKENELEEHKKALEETFEKLKNNYDKCDELQQILTALSDEILKVLLPIQKDLYNAPAVQEYLKLLEKVNIEELSGFGFLNLGCLYQLGALLCGKVSPVEPDETFSVVCRNKYNEIIDEYIYTEEHEETDKVFYSASRPKASTNKTDFEAENPLFATFVTATQADEKNSEIKEAFEKIHSLPRCFVFKKEFLEELKTFVSETKNVDLIDIFEHFAEDDLNNSLALAKDFVSFKTLYRATPEEKIAIDNEYYQSMQTEATNETYNPDSDFQPYTTLSQSDLEDLRLERTEREARQAREAAERAAEIEKIDRDLAKRREERDRQEAQREQMRAQSAANMRCNRCANHDACGNSRGIINCGAFTPNLKY